jgi:transcription antitermination factor NusG
MGLKVRQPVQQVFGNNKRKVQAAKEANVDFNKSSSGWCAVQVRPRYEIPVAAGLRAKGYKEFLPTYQIKRQWSDRKKVIEVPLFPGYVFCKLDIQIPWAIVSTPGVIRIVGTRKEIALIDDQEIEAIRTVASSGKKVQPCAYTGIGDRIRITSGALAGVEGIVVGYKNQQRLVLSVDQIQSSISIEVDGCSVELVSQAQKNTSGEIWTIASEHLPAIEREFSNAVSA